MSNDDAHRKTEALIDRAATSNADREALRSVSRDPSWGYGAAVRALFAEVDRLTAWQLAVADGLGFVNRADGQSGYEVAKPSVIVAYVKGAERDGNIETVRELRDWLDQERVVIQQLRARVESLRDEAAHAFDAGMLALEAAKEEMREACALRFEAWVGPDGESVRHTIRATPLASEPLQERIRELEDLCTTHYVKAESAFSRGMDAAPQVDRERAEAAEARVMELEAEIDACMAALEAARADAERYRLAYESAQSALEDAQAGRPLRDVLGRHDSYTLTVEKLRATKADLAAATQAHHETAQERARLSAEVFDMRRAVTTQKVLHDDERAAVAATLRYVRGRIDCAHPDIQRACDSIDKLLLAATPGEKS